MSGMYNEKYGSKSLFSACSGSYMNLNFDKRFDYQNSHYPEAVKCDFCDSKFYVSEENIRCPNCGASYYNKPN